jgi:hypothetical protein
VYEECCAFSAAAVLGQTVPGRYVVELAGDPGASRGVHCNRWLEVDRMSLDSRHAAPC